MWLRRWIFVETQPRPQFSRSHFSSHLADGDSGDFVGASRVDPNVYGDGYERRGKQGRDVGVVRQGLQWRGVRNTFGGQQRVGSGGDLHGACQRAKSGTGDADGNVGHGWNQNSDRGDYGHGSDSGNRGDFVPNDGERRGKRDHDV